MTKFEQMKAKIKVSTDFCMTIKDIILANRSDVISNDTLDVLLKRLGEYATK